VAALRLWIPLAGLLLAGLAGAEAPEQYRVESQLWLDGEPQEVAPMIIGVDQPGFLLQTNEDGRATEDSWRLELRASPVDDPLGLSQSLWVEVRLSLFRGGFWEPILDSMLGVPEGEFSTLSITPDGLDPAPETAEVYLRLRTERLSSRPEAAATDGT
jgi:hypothetical protein